MHKEQNNDPINFFSRFLVLRQDFFPHCQCPKEMPLKKARPDFNNRRRRGGRIQTLDRNYRGYKCSLFVAEASPTQS